jgi:DNA primase
MMSSPYEYSENWEKKWDLFLHSQEMPDHNFIQDSLSSLKRFRLRKLKKMLERNQLKIKELSEGNDFEQAMIYMKLHQKIKTIHDDLAKEMGSVVL